MIYMVTISVNEDFAKYLGDPSYRKHQNGVSREREIVFDIGIEATDNPDVQGDLTLDLSQWFKFAYMGTVHANLFTENGVISVRAGSGNDAADFVLRVIEMDGSVPSGTLSTEAIQITVRGV